MALQIDRDNMTNDVLHGCLVSCLCIVTGTFLIFFVLAKAMAEPTADFERAIQLIIWFFGIAIGGYVASHRSQRGYRVSLNVGLLATIFIVARLPHVEPGDFTDGLFEVFKNPAANWRHIIGLTLTVPAALLGGLIAQRRHG